MNKAILLIVPVLAHLTTATILRQQNAHATTYITNFGNGYAGGKHAAQHTFHSAGYRDTTCRVSFWDNISYCSGYHIGYDTVWAELSSENRR
jgi:hypothetical protein